MNYDFLDKVVKQVVGETIIDVAQNRISMPQGGSIYTLSGYHTVLFLKIPLYDFFNHCKEVYGLTMDEIHYVWSIYRNIIKDKIEDVEQEPLNESTGHKFLDKVVERLIDETSIDYVKGEMIIPFTSAIMLLIHFIGMGREMMENPFYTIPSFSRHCRDVYGLTNPEIIYVWKEYKNIITNKVYDMKPLNESEDKQ